MPQRKISSRYLSQQGTELLKALVEVTNRRGYGHWQYVEEAAACEVIVVDIDQPAGHHYWDQLLVANGRNSFPPMAVAYTAYPKRLLASAAKLDKPLRSKRLWAVLEELSVRLAAHSKRAAAPLMEGEPLDALCLDDGAGVAVGQAVATPELSASQALADPTGLERLAAPAGEATPMAQGGLLLHRLLNYGRAELLLTHDSYCAVIDFPNQLAYGSGEILQLLLTAALPGPSLQLVPPPQLPQWTTKLPRQPLAPLLWRIALAHSHGGLLKGIDGSTPLQLARWPELAKLPHNRWQLRVLHLLKCTHQSVEQLREKVHRPDGELVAFINACLLIGSLMVAPERRLQGAQEEVIKGEPFEASGLLGIPQATSLLTPPKITRRRGLLSSLRQRLGGGG